MEKPHQSLRQSPISSLATCVLEVDLSIVRQNFLKLQTYCQNIDAKAQLSAVIKANAYGVGFFEIAQTLYDVNCKIFYVATPSEGIVLRQKYNDIKIFILDGLFIGSEDIYKNHKLTPCLATAKQISAWVAYNQANNIKLACVLHFNTGINRLGINFSDYLRIEQGMREQLNIDHIFSHFASADVPDDPQNIHQLEQFNLISKALPNCTCSFGNSAALAYKPLQDTASKSINILRPGIAIFGVKTTDNYPIDLKPAVAFSARVLQISDLKKGESVGYNHAYVCEKAMKVAIIGAGYADGIFRSLSTSTTENPDNSKHAYFKYREFRLPILGKVSMDMTVVDASELPDGLLQEGDFVEIFGKTTKIAQFADWAGTITYEVLTNIGARVEKRYL